MDKFEGKSFEEAMKLLEERIVLLENDDIEDFQEVYEEAMELKAYCSLLLKKEREEIKKIAKENNIPLSEIGLSDAEEDNNDEDEDNE